MQDLQQMNDIGQWFQEHYLETKFAVWHMHNYAAFDSISVRVVTGPIWSTTHIATSCFALHCHCFLQSFFMKNIHCEENIHRTVTREHLWGATCKATILYRPEFQCNHCIESTYTTRWPIYGYLCNQSQIEYDTTLLTLTAGPFTKCDARVPPMMVVVYGHS